MNDELNQSDQPVEEALVCDDCGVDVPAGVDECPECGSHNLSPASAEKEEADDLGDEWEEDEVDDKLELEDEDSEA